MPNIAAAPYTCALIGGTGFGQLADFHLVKSIEPTESTTPYGAPSAKLVHGEFAGQPLIFLARHGEQHHLAPHQINYRANLYSLAAAGITEIIALAAVGGIRPDCTPGKVVIPDQLIDYTWGRDPSFAYDQKTPSNDLATPTCLTQVPAHIDFTEPYDAPLRARLLTAAQATAIACVPNATYAVTQGPRLETAAEINRYEQAGAHIVGMTALPEAALARELGLAYANLAFVVNAAAGRGTVIITADLEKNLKTATDNAYTVLRHFYSSGR